MEILFQAITSSILTSGIIIYLSKTWISERLKNAIKYEYDEKLVSHKIQLNAQNNIELERLKSQLKETSTEHQIKFVKLHEKRAEVISKTYALLHELYITLSQYTNPVQFSGAPQQDERKKLFVEAYNAFYDYYPKNIIYLPKKTVLKIDYIDKELKEQFFQFLDLVEENEKMMEARLEWMKISKKINEDMKKPLSELEDEFRILLGEKS